MRAIFPSLLLTACVTNSSNAPEQEVGAQYQTTKSLGAIEQCLTDALSTHGEVVSVNVDGTKTLVFREGSEAPLLIDLAPPSVKVTTRMAPGVRRIVKACL